MAKKWTEEEDALVLEFYKNQDRKEDLMKLLPARSLAAIRKRASRELGVTNPKWTEEEETVLQDCYHKNKN